MNEIPQTASGLARAASKNTSVRYGLLVVSVQKWALSTGKTVIERIVRQCSRETALLKRQREQAAPIRQELTIDFPVVENGRSSLQRVLSVPQRPFLFVGYKQAELDIAEMLIWNFEDTYPEFVKLERAVQEFKTYVENNRELIPNYGERYRYGERISTGFVESTINQVVAKRFSKRQQMQWTPRGAHLLLQTRTRVLNGELASRFRRWYPNFRAGEKGDSGELEDDPLYRLAA